MPDSSQATTTPTFLERLRNGTTAFIDHVRGVANNPAVIAVEAKVETAVEQAVIALTPEVEAELVKAEPIAIGLVLATVGDFIPAPARAFVQAEMKTVLTSLITSALGSSAKPATPSQ